MSALLLDTHAAIWARDGSIGKTAGRAIDFAASKNELMLSPISAWEIAMLVSKKRFAIASDVGEYVRSLFAQSGVVTAAITAEIALSAARLSGFHGDPVDRFLIASAVAYAATFVTRDRRIHDYAKKTKLLRCIDC